MSISLKAELEIWATALKAYDEQDFDKALELFSGIADSSKILTNMGLIYATVGEHEIAVQHFVAATNLDSYLAIAYRIFTPISRHFQCGVSNFLIERYDLALLNFEDAYLYLRGNEAINYEQIGLKFKLFSAEILFNKGLTQLNLGYAEEGMSVMQEASRQKVTSEHGVIDEAIRDRGEGYTVFSIPVGVLYRPSENKVKNSKSKDYIGKAKLVAASDSNDAFTEFSGIKKLKQVGENSDHKEDRNVSDQRKPYAKSPAPGNAALSAPNKGSESIAARRTALGRSKTTPQRGAMIRPNAATILASRRTQSVSNPANAPQPTGLTRSNLASGRSNTTRVARSATASPVVTPPRTKTPQGTAPGAASSPGSTRGVEEAGAIAAGTAAVLRRPSLRRAQGTGTPHIVSPQPSSASIQPPQYVIPTQDVTSLVLPIAPVPTVAGHLTQFYDSYMDVYADPILRPVMSRSPHSPQQSEELEQSLSSLAPSALSPVIASSYMNASATPPPWDASMGKGNNSAGGETIWREPSRCLVRKGIYERELEGDEGFVAGGYNMPQMAIIRVKLHYQDDVRGMTMRLTTSFGEFVERVTVKFGTSLMGLGMKFVDEEGTKISLRDESDFELAIETARENARGRSEGKLEVWCVDV